MQDERTDDLEYTPRRKSGSGCLLWGCISLVIVAIIGGVVIYLGYRELVEIVEEYTETEPRELPAAELPEDEIPGVLARWDEFDQALEAGEPARLELTDDELNALIQNSPDWSHMKDSVYLEIDEQDRLRGQFSLPVGEYLPFGEGRYFNGTATFEARKMEQGVALKVFEAEGNEKALPEEILESPVPVRLEPLERLDRIDVQEGKLILVSEGKGAEGG